MTGFSTILIRSHYYKLYFWSCPSVTIEKKFKCTTKERYFSKLFQIWQRGDTNQLQRYDQKCGKLCRNKLNFKRLSLCFLGLNFNDTSLRSLRSIKLYDHQSCSWHKKYPKVITFQPFITFLAPIPCQYTTDWGKSEKWNTNKAGTF